MTKRTPIVVMLALAVAALGLRIAFADVLSPAAAAPPDAAPAAPGVAAADRADLSRDPGAAPVEAAASATVRDELSPAAAQPLPDDANWIDLLVVDETGAPIGGADVYWYDASAWPRIRELGQLTEREIEALVDRPERVIRHAGWQTRSDEHGRTRVTTTDDAVVAGVHEGRYGRLHLAAHVAAPPDGLRLVLAPDRRVTVLVHDDLDRPAAGVPVTLAVIDEQGDFSGPFGWHPMADTDERGVAVVEHLQELERSLRDVGQVGEASRVVARALLPGCAEPTVRLSLAAPPSDPIVLRLPPCGSVRAQLRLGGQPVIASTEFEVQCEQEHDWAMAQARPGASGWAHFPRVAVGKRYRLSSASRGRVDTSFAGPAVREQEVQVVLSSSTDRAQLRGRLLDAGRHPLAERRGFTYATGDSLPSHADFVTDAEGRFHVDLGSAEDERPVEGIVFVVPATNAPSLRAELPPRTLRAGVEDLGDVGMVADDLVVAGRMLVDGEPVRRGLHVMVQRLDPAAEAQETWEGVFYGPMPNAPDGHFAVHGERRPGRYRIFCYTSETQPLGPIEFAFGATDLVVEGHRGYRLAASMLLPPDTPPELVRVELIAQSVSTPGDEPLHDAQEPTPMQGPRHALQWGRLSAGAYTIAVSEWTAHRPLVSIPDVQVPAPPGGDPRLVDIDLQPLLRVVTVRVFDPDGGPIAAQGAIFAAGLRADEDWRGVPIWGEEAVRIPLRRGPVDLVVAVEGYRPTPVRGAGDELSVRLQRWSELAITLADVPPLPAGVRLSVRSEAKEFASRAWSGPWSAGSLDRLLGGSAPSAEVAGGRATLRCGDGPQRLVVTVSSDRGSRDVEDIAPAEILPVAGPVTLRAPAAAWRRAIAAVAQPR